MGLKSGVTGGRRIGRIPFLGVATAKKLRICRLRQDDLGIWPFLAHHPANARNRAASTVSGHKIIEPRPFEIGEDLARRRGLVNGGIGVGFELRGQKPAMRLGQRNRLLVHAKALEGAGRQDHLGPEHPHQPPPLDRKAVGHGDHKRVSLLRANHRQPDPGIAAGGLYHGLTRFQRT